MDDTRFNRLTALLLIGGAGLFTMARGMSMVYVDGKGALHCNNIPSLQGLWQLDEAYAQEI